jgi:endonuclease YncB( thermonuclease family)
MLTALTALIGCAAPPPTRADTSALESMPTSAPAELPPAGTPKPTDERLSAGTWNVTRVVDGDTLDVTNDQTSETVRILGIDTPERGDCGYASAAAYLRRLVTNKAVTLTAAGPGKDDRDRYRRLLRYVEVGGVDAGLALINQGLAIARYDSRDGYGAHPREGAYVSRDEAVPPKDCPAGEPTGESPRARPNEALDAGEVHYSSCAAARAAGAAPVYRGQAGYGSHLDRDHDGIGCE